MGWFGVGGELDVDLQGGVGGAVGFHIGVFDS